MILGLGPVDWYFIVVISTIIIGNFAQLLHERRLTVGDVLVSLVISSLPVVNLVVLLVATISIVYHFAYKYSSTTIISLDKPKKRSNLE